METLKVIFSKSLWKFVITAVVIILIAYGGFFVYSRYFSPTSQMWSDYEKSQQKTIDALTADTYGGKTPQETLNLFIAALKSGDLDLASKYFQLETDPTDKNYLKNGNWNDVLAGIKNEGKVGQLIEAIAQMSPSRESTDISSRYVLMDGTGLVQATLKLSLNQYSSVWKIESL